MFNSTEYSYLLFQQSPSLGVQAQKKREKEEAANDRRLHVFRTLMETRADRLSPKHIEALNLIDIEFYNIKDVTHAWREYVDHLNTPQEKNEEWQTRWNAKCDDLFIDMLYKMSESLNYNFTKLDIRKNAYLPVAYSQQDFTKQEIDTHLANVLTGRQSLPIIINSKHDKEG